MTLFDCFSVLRVGAAGVLLVCISLRDMRSRRIPGRLVFLLAAVSLLRLVPELSAGFCPAVFFDMLLGGTGTLLLLVAAVCLADRFAGRKTLGGGDIKLSAALGLHLGLLPALYMLLAASLLALPEALIRRRRGEYAFPFAPYLAAAGWVMMLLN